MRNVINFLIRFKAWFLFAAYVIVSLLLLFNFNDYQQSYYMTSANSFCASINGIRSEFTGYIGLKQVNRDLELQNSALLAEVQQLKLELLAAKEQVPDTNSIIPQKKRFSYIVASVLSNNTNQRKNYFTINKGTRHGIKPGMGVISHKGMVGIVNVAGPNASRVISVLNETQHFSVKLAGTPYVGTLTWSNRNPKWAYVEEVPRHAKFHKGDTIVSSGFSTTFPEGMPIGRVMATVKRKDDNFVTLKIRLIPDFERLETVWVINDIYKSELDTLAKSDLH